jgi:SAM-dependent methyltransferase
MAHRYLIDEIQISRQLAALNAWLPAPPRRLLDAGCGMGQLAAALVTRGYDVRAIDIDPDAVAAARANGVQAHRANLIDFDDAPFDVVVCSLSLHHVDGLDHAVERIHHLLAPGGVLVVDEFAWEQADHRTAAWFYDMAAVLESAGLLPPREQPQAAADPLERWITRHRDEDPMNTGESIITQIERRFEVRELRRVPYLHRYLGGWLTGRNASAVFDRLAEVEQLRVMDRTVHPVGVQLLAQRTGRSQLAA